MYLFNKYIVLTMAYAWFHVLIKINSFPPQNNHIKSHYLHFVYDNTEAKKG